MGSFWNSSCCFSLFICSLFNDASSVTKAAMNERVIREWWIENDLYGSCRSLILRHNPDIRLEGLRKITKSLSQDSRSPGRNLNPEPPEYGTGALTTRPRRWVTRCFPYVFMTSAWLLHRPWRTVHLVLVISPDALNLYCNPTSVKFGERGVQARGPLRPIQLFPQNGLKWLVDGEDVERRCDSLTCLIITDRNASQQKRLLVLHEMQAVICYLSPSWMNVPTLSSLIKTAPH
jgi:hypothetical protein